MVDCSGQHSMVRMRTGRCKPACEGLIADVRRLTRHGHLKDADLPKGPTLTWTIKAHDVADLVTRQPAGFGSP